MKYLLVLVVVLLVLTFHCMVLKTRLRFLLCFWPVKSNHICECKIQNKILCRSYETKWNVFRFKSGNVFFYCNMYVSFIKEDWNIAWKWHLIKMCKGNDKKTYRTTLFLFSKGSKTFPVSTKEISIIIFTWSIIQCYHLYVFQKNVKILHSLQKQQIDASSCMSLQL